MDKERFGKVIGGGRMRGKTTELIKRAASEKLYIVCANYQQAKAISKQAKDLGLIIPEPITAKELPLSNINVDRVLVDEVEMVLRNIIGKRIECMSTSYELEEWEPVRDWAKPSPLILPQAPIERAPLLEIVLQDESSVPKVFHEGKEITDKLMVTFDWESETGELGSGGTKFNIEYCEAGHKVTVRKGIGLKTGKYADE